MHHDHLKFMVRTSIRYTRNNGNVYATVLDWKDSVITLKALHAGGSTIGKVSKVELIGSDVSMSFNRMIRDSQ